MKIKDIQNFFTVGYKDYQKRCLDEDCIGIAIQKNFKKNVVELLNDIPEDDEESQCENTELFIQSELLQYFQKHSLTEKFSTHHCTDVIVLEDQKPYVFWFVFRFQPYFICHINTINNAVKYNIHLKDPFLIEIKTMMEEINSAIDQYITGIEMEEWFVTDLSSKL